MAPLAGQKRKVDYNASGTTAQARKRQKGRDARAIPSQTADAALSKSGELNIAAFVKAREFEIAALDQSMKKSRKSLTQRVFQNLPRHMRRRTASHNVKKIPRRLRGRAAREIKEDNTPTGSARNKKPSAKLRLRLETAKKLQRLNTNRKSVRQKKREAKRNAKEPDPEKHISTTRVPRIKKNKLAGPPQATSKYKRRQINKTWLPTHLWHTKRAHMTRPTLPLWKMAIPLRPTEKSYRPTHRAVSTRGCIAWDTSYLSTVACQGTDSALEGMLKALGFPGEGWTGAKYKRWKTGLRFAEGWVHERDNAKSPIAPVTVLWQVKPDVPQSELPQPDQMDLDERTEANAKRRRKTKLDRRLFMRLHPSAFHHFWKELLNAAKMQKPQVLVEDLRFEIGSIKVQGSGSTEALIGVLKSAQSQKHIKTIWPALSALHNPASLPQNSMLAFNIMDPRLNHPPKQVSVASQVQSTDKLNELIVTWPPDKDFPSSKIWDHKYRYMISRTLPSQKAINRRRTALLPGQQTELTEKDPEIPVMLMAHRSQNAKSNSQGSWTVLLPWSCVDLVWRSLMYYPLSTGKTPKFGGLSQTQQVAFEHAVPWYPADYPGTEAGKERDRTESEQRFDTWLRRPRSKRFSWEALDLGLGRKGEVGRGWACDWEFLFKDTNPARVTQQSTADTIITESSAKSTEPRLLTQRQRKAAAAKAEQENEAQARRRNTSSPESGDEQNVLHNDVKYSQLTPAQAAEIFGLYNRATAMPNPTLATVRIRYLTRGTPKAAARIYRLPATAKSISSEPVVQEPAQMATKNSDKTDHRAVQPSFRPVLFTDQSPTSSSAFDKDLRQRWLGQDPGVQSTNTKSSTDLPDFDPKEKRDRYGDVSAHRVYDAKHTKDLSHIRVFPPRETKPQVLNIFGPAPPKKTPEQILKTMQPQLVPKMIVNSDGELVDEGVWDKHVPCPDAEDLIGFVTTGGYSLAEGRGMAIGGIWTQRVIEGWKREEQVSESAGKARAGAGPQQAKANAQPKTTEPQQVRQEKQSKAQVVRERHLCIVRNAGEAVGRLALWELC